MIDSGQSTIRYRGLDYARAFAIVCIFFIHSMEPLATAAAGGNWGLQVEKNLLESLVRTGVCLFLGISGALLLGRQEPLKVFFRKRFRRIFLPFLFWSIVVYSLDCILEPPADWGWVVPRFIVAFLTNGVHSIYWFVYLIIGLYMLTPLLRVICQAGYSGYLAAVTAAVYLLGTFVPAFQPARLFLCEGSSALLCFVLGDFLFRQKDRKGMKAVAWASVAVGLTAAGILLLFLQIPQKEDTGVLAHVFKKTGAYSYGMYLSHFLLISLFLRLGFSSLPVAWEPFIMVLAVWAAEWLMMWVAERLGLKRLVM